MMTLVCVCVCVLCVCVYVCLCVCVCVCVRFRSQQIDIVVRRSLTLYLVCVHARVCRFLAQLCSHLDLTVRSRRVDLLSCASLRFAVLVCVWRVVGFHSIVSRSSAHTHTHTHTRARTHTCTAQGPTVSRGAETAAAKRAAVQRVLTPVNAELWALAASDATSDVVQWRPVVRCSERRRECGRCVHPSGVALRAR
jgi:hypothetical protein